MYDIINNIESDNVLCLIGKADLGQSLEPYYADSYTETISEFGSGELVDYYKFAYNLGVHKIYLIRIDYDTSREKYHAYKKAYEIVEVVKPEVVYPIGVKADETIQDYKEINVYKESFQLESSTDQITLEKNIFFLDKLKIEGISLYNYIVEGNTITLPQAINEGAFVEVVYYPFENIKFELTLVVFEDKKIKETKDIILEYNPHDDENIIGDKLKEYFDFDAELNLDYYIKHPYPYAEFYSEIDGESPITVTIDMDKYWQLSLEEKSYHDFIISHSISGGCLSVMEGLKESETNSALNFQKILKKDSRSSFHLIVALGSCFYKSLSAHHSTAGLIAANIALNGIKEGMTNHRLDGVGSFNNLDLDVNLLSQNGYSMLKKSIRNGTVIKKATTMGDVEDGFVSIRDVRVALYFKRQWDKIINTKYIGNSVALHKTMMDDLTDLLEKMLEDDKINDYDFHYHDRKNELNVALVIDHEIDLMKHSILSNPAY